MPNKINPLRFILTTISRINSATRNNDSFSSNLANVKNTSDYSIENFTKDASSFCKKKGNSYTNIVSHLVAIKGLSDSNKLEAELKLYQEAGEYIDKHPNSSRNGAMKNLRDSCSKHISESKPASNDAYQYDEVQAALQLCKIREGVATTQKIDFNIQQMSDGSKLLADSPRAPELLNELQKPIIHGQINDELDKAKVDGDAIKDKADLNKNEIESIQWYTSVGFQYINAALRNGEQLTSFLKDHGENTISGLSKLSPFTGTVYRALVVDNLSSLAEKLTPGQLVTDKGFISTSSSPSFAKTFRGGKGTVIYSIDNVTTGKNIAGYAQLKQAEVLLLPGHHMRVTAAKLTGQNLYVVLESTNKFHKGESVCNIASGDTLGIAINDETTTVSKEIRIESHLFGNPPSK